MKLVQRCFHELCIAVDTPYSLDKWLRYRYAHDELAIATINPLDYSDPIRFGLDYACVTFLRKYEGLNTGVDLQATALSKFGNSERRCLETNRNLQMAAVAGRLARSESGILLRIQKNIAKVWGNPSFQDIFSHCNWGPGATSTLKGKAANREDKMSQFPVSLSPAALPFFRQMISHDVLWLRHLLKQDVCGPTTLLACAFDFTSQARILTVPKDSRSDRTIGAEPTGNLFLQKGVGTYLRRRLKRFGVNLDSQKENQDLAAAAHRLGLATLDLSSASDTIAIQAVKLVCPPDMFNMLNCIRSPEYLIAGEEAKRFHKFSSMGNGFTFELESLIFWAVARAIADDRASGLPIGIYGDDIIVGQEIALQTIEVLEDLGFEINKEKSFIDGRFFESCGKHYFDGYDVTPPYQKHLVESPLELIRMANRIFDWILRLEQFMDRPAKELWKMHTNLVRAFGSLSDLTFTPKGFWWLEGDGFFRSRHDPDLKYNQNYGFSLRYIAEKAPPKVLGDGGLYADYMRSTASTPFCMDSLPTYGMVQLRKGRAVAKTCVKKRWVHREGRTVAYDQFVI